MYTTFTIHMWPHTSIIHECGHALTCTCQVHILKCYSPGVMGTLMYFYSAAFLLSALQALLLALPVKGSPN